MRAGCPSSCRRSSSRSPYQPRCLSPCTLEYLTRDASTWPSPTSNNGELAPSLRNGPYRHVSSAINPFFVSLAITPPRPRPTVRPA